MFPGSTKLISVFFLLSYSNPNKNSSKNHSHVTEYEYHFFVENLFKLYLKLPKKKPNNKMTATNTKLSDN